mmetsp:Transcript_5852/g.8190  ORF Transcript_5852/g.8190 Transcript_5852/m.8190 type:complete len:267 (-) Transcript_5852:9-809(-)
MTKEQQATEEINLEGLDSSKKNKFVDFKKAVFSDDNLTEDQRKWLDDHCLLRYLRARSFDQDKSLAMIQETLKWRFNPTQYSKVCPYKITADDVKEVLSLGTMYQNGHTKDGYPIIYITPGAYNPNSVEQRINFLIFAMETAISTMNKAHSVEKMCWVCDFSAYGNRSKSPDSMEVTKASVNILQNHYPERLGLCFVINAPWYFSLLYKIVSLLLDPVTKEKIHWVSGNKEQIGEYLQKYIDVTEIEERFGGKNQRQFNPNAFVQQ